MKNYKLPKNSEKMHITQTVRKYFKYALKYALENNQNNVKVNGTEFYFDFKNKKIEVWTGFYHRRDYNNSIIEKETSIYNLIED